MPSENSAAAYEGLAEAVGVYERALGIKTQRFEGTSPGALAFGIHRFDA
jgi:hypothetical protein